MKCPVIAIVIPLLTEIALTTYKLSYVTAMPSGQWIPFRIASYVFFPVFGLPSNYILQSMTCDVRSHLYKLRSAVASCHVRAKSNLVTCAMCVRAVHF